MAGLLKESRLLGWRLMRPRADDFLLVPSDMRPKDPSLFDEIASGQFGLAGVVVDIAGSSPFGLSQPASRWARALNGFGWLGDLRAAGGEEALEFARRLVSDWVTRNRRTPGGVGVAGEPRVIARRVISWIAAAGFLLEDADAAFYRRFMQALGLELRALDARRAMAPPGLPRLECLMALVQASLAIAGQDARRPGLEVELQTELKRQILADGGHISRNPDIVVEVLLDLLPIRQCYAARGLAVPPALAEQIERMLGFLCFISTTTGRLGRFNGVGPARPEVLATVLAFDSRGIPSGTGPGTSGYVRLSRGASTLLMDCGPSPPLSYAAMAAAGCLSFELTDASGEVLVNRGWPAGGARTIGLEARATASHSTLALDGHSSGELVQARALDRLLGAPAMVGPGRVVTSVSEEAGTMIVEAWHDGYLARVGLVHERRLELAPDGGTLDGADRLRGLKGTMRLARDLPFAIHFHLPVAASAETDASGGIVIWRAVDAPPWRLSAMDGTLAVETATDYAQILGPVPARQIVLRSACAGEIEIRWRLERLDA